VWTHPFNRPTLQACESERLRRNSFYSTLLLEVGVPEDVRATMAQMRSGIGEYAAEVSVAGGLDEGDTVSLAGRAWRVLHTPGHSSGLICLYEPESRVLLSNDHLLRDISSNPLAEPPPLGRAERFKALVEYISQLRRVAAMDIAVAWPGHGEAVRDIPELVRQRIEFHTRRAGRIAGLLDGEALTAYQLSRILFPQLDPMNFFLAISEVLGHLEWLQAQGRITSTRQAGIVAWRGLAIQR
jgi:glyoxylase-like metal-dependent hydrolase (beta-lactamase superfamily II)